MKTAITFILALLFISDTFSQKIVHDDVEIYSFGEGGQHKMIYDRRQRPQAVLTGDEIHIVYNGGAPAGTTDRVKTTPHALTFNLKTKNFSPIVELPGKPSRDHHYGPIIWADHSDYLHVLSGCHKTPGTHVVSKKKTSIGSNADDWKTGEQIAPSMSYPSVSRVLNNRYLIYYRVYEHRSSWTYSISDTDGNSWTTQANPIVDLNNGGELLDVPHAEMDEASSYHTYLPDPDGNSIHIAFMYYDDNKGELAEKYYNPLYKRDVGTLKTNLYYVEVNLGTNEVTNDKGKTLKTPVTLDQANKHCKIWDTNWRGSGVPPDIMVDRNGNPSFLHVITEEIFEKLNYYYVRKVNGEWKQTIVAPACHKWNSGHIQMDEKGVLHAYLLMDDGYFDSKGKGLMNNHGGGKQIEEWISSDDGNSWSKKRTLFKAGNEYSGWRFNNVQPVKFRDGKIKDGVFLFYGWKDGDASQAKAFLLIHR